MASVRMAWMRWRGYSKFAGWRPLANRTADAFVGAPLGAMYFFAVSVIPAQVGTQVLAPAHSDGARWFKHGSRLAPDDGRGKNTAGAQASRPRGAPTISALPCGTHRLGRVTLP